MTSGGDNARAITLALGGRWCGAYGLARCPAHDDRQPSLKVRDDANKLDGIDVHCFRGCRWQDVKIELQRHGLLQTGPRRYPVAAEARVPGTNVPSEISGGDEQQRQQQRDKARWLWRHKRPIAGSPAERYLREVRKYRGPLSTTLGFLPARRPSHHPALIAAFGLADESEPGTLSIRDDEVRGIHFTLLKPDGSGKAGTDGDKIMVGPSSGWPIVIAPPSDLLALAVTEGIEDALSAHQATGLGAWAAGAAGRMPTLADKVPDYIEVVTIYAHHDEAGQRGAHALADALLLRGIEVFMEGIA